MRPLLLAACLLVCAPLTAAAQDHKGDVFGGYSLIRSDGESFHGAEFSLGLNLSGGFGIVFDVAAHRASFEEEDVTTTSFLAGPRLSFGGTGTRPYVHALVGLVRTKSGISAFGVDISESATDPGGAFGGGIDFKFGNKWAARAQADYRLVRFDVGGEKSTEGDPRFSAGVVLRFGSR